MAILPKAIYTFNVIPIKTPKTFFTELEKCNSKIFMEPRKTQNCQPDPAPGAGWFYLRIILPSPSKTSRGLACDLT